MAEAAPPLAPAPALRIGDTIPNPTVTAYQAGESEDGVTFSLHDYFGDGWGILFSHPADYTPVCTTELGKVQELSAEWSARNTKVIALSCDSVASHAGWARDIAAYTNQEIQYPIIADESRELAVLFNMLDVDLKDANGLPLTVRSVFIVGPDKKIKLMLTYPASTGRHFDEILRVLDSLQLAISHQIATPVNWTKGTPCVVLPFVRTEDIVGEVTIAELPSNKQYLRLVPDPSAQ
jgi:1-Cys peroxiredoxin 6